MVEEKEATQMIKYVLGFLFNGDDQVVLIKQQDEKLNGVEGKIKADETAPQAMERTFVEKTGISSIDWKMFGSLGSADKTGMFTCWLFCATDNKADELITLKDKEVDLYSIDEVFGDEYFVRNLLWLLPLAQETLSGSGPIFTQANYQEAEVEKWRNR